MGIKGILYAGCLADFLCFIIAIFVIRSEYVKLKEKDYKDEVREIVTPKEKYKSKHMVVTIAREYASGGRYVGRILADLLGVDFYDKELIDLAAKESGLAQKYISEMEQRERKSTNDDRIFIAEAKTIRNLAKVKSCVIVGRCADYILRDEKDVVKIFLYSSEEDKVKRAVKYYGLDKNEARKKIEKINKDREKHYKFYTNREWRDMSNYDLMINVDSKGVKATAHFIEEYLEKN